MSVKQSAASASLTSDDAIDIYRRMSKIHLCDERIRKALAAGEIAMSYWPVDGQEAMSAGAMSALDPGDQLVTTYRGLGDVVAKGAALERYFAELIGKSSGLSKGKAGAMGICDPDAGVAWSTGIVGEGPPIANGLAMAASLGRTGQVVLVSFGDGATSIGYVHEAMNMAAAWSLPVVFFCQNNAWAECTPVRHYTRSETFAGRAAGYGMPGVTVDGLDPVAVYSAVTDAAARARAGEGPTFVEAVAYRLQGHYFGDGMAYVDADELASARAQHPLDLYRDRLIEEGMANKSLLDEIDEELRAEIESALSAARTAADPPADELEVDVFAGVSSDAWVAPATSPTVLPADETEDLSLAQAINRTLDRAMARDQRVVVLGEDIADPGGGMFKVTAGLSTKYGTERVRDTPIAESAIMGAALGAALGGLRPVAELMFMDFLGVALDQIANHAAKARYLSGGRQSAPMVIRTMVGRGAGPQHSQALEAWAMHVPGIKVVWPSTALDAAGLFASCLQDPDPCLFIESMQLYYGAAKGQVPVADYTIPIGQADLKRSGTDVTVVAYGTMVHAALAAAAELEPKGVSVEVVDLRTLVPLDVQTILDSVGRTGRLVVAHESVGFCGPGAEIAAIVGQRLFGQLQAPVERVTGSYTPVPRAASLEALCRPSAASIAEAVSRLA